MDQRILPVGHCHTRIIPSASMMFFSASVRRDALSAVQLHTAARTAVTNPPAKISFLIPVFIFNIISDKKYKISQFPRQMI